MKYVCFLLCFCTTMAFSQVGIGTTSPNASLDIRSTNEATPSNTDGLLIPKVEEYPAINPTALQDGMIVFATGTGSVAKGFYYWDNASVNWIFINSSATLDHDWYEEGTTASPNSINDEIFTLGNVAIGKNTADYTLDIESSTGNRGVNNLLNGNTTGGSYLYGLYNDVVDTGDGYIIGAYNVVGGGTSSKIGTFNNPSNTALSYTTGTVNQLFNVLGNGIQYGTEQRLFNNGGGIRYGTFNHVAGTQVTGGDPPQPVYGSYQRIGIISQGDHFGSYNEMSGLGNGAGNVYGSYNNLSAATSGNQYGSYNIINTPSIAGTNYGLFSQALFANSYAGYFLGNVAIGTTTANTYTLPTSDGTANQIMQTDGAGNATWVDPSASVTHEINDLVDGRSDNDGTQDGSSIFLGIGAGLNDDGSDNQNIGIGFNALNRNEGGVRNTAIGYGSIQRNLNGNSNTALGQHTLNQLVTGIGNTALGRWAMELKTSGSYNTAVGLHALQDDITGESNTAVGSRAGTLVRGNQNTFLGRDSGSSTASRGLSGSVFLGYSSGYSENNSNRLYIENSNADADNALIYGEFDNDILRTNGTFQIGNPVGTGYALPIIDGTANQIMQTDGAGAMTWVDPSASVTHSINDLVDGKSDNDGTDDGSSIFLGMNAGINDDETNNLSIGIGLNAMTNNSSGNNNIGLGIHSLLSNTTGFGNTALGNNSLSSNIDGSGNVGVGGVSLYALASGISNTAVGFNALGALTSGNRNVAMGLTTGFNISIGSSNTILGYRAGYASTIRPLNGSVFLGAFAGMDVTQNNRLYIENSSASNPLIYGEFDTDILGFNADVAIGHQAPLTPLHIINEGTADVQNIVATLASNTSNRPVLLFSETATASLTDGMSLEYDGRGNGNANRMSINNLGGNPLFEFSNGGNLTLMNGDIVVRGTATDREIKIEDDAGNADRALMRQTGTQDIYVGDIDNNGGDTYIRAGGSTEISVISGTGFVGVNTTTPAFTLEVNGNAGKPGGGSWINASDRRLKMNIQPYSEGIETLLKINPVRYQYNQLSGFDQSKTHVGVVAQELQKIAPSMVVTNQRENGEFLAVDNSEMTYMLINAVQEQQEKIESLEREIAEIKSLLKKQ